MRNLKPYIVALLISIMSLYAPISFANNEANTASNSQKSEPTNSEQFDEEAVAIAQATQNNKALKPLNDTVLGNDAIRDTLPQTSPNNNQNTATVADADNQVNAQPRQSTAKSVDSDKLILNSPVVDQAAIFTPQEKQMLEQRLRHIYDQGLAQAALVTVPTTQGMDIFDYSLQVADKWQLGNKDTDDGLLILVAVNDRNMYILSGYGLEGVLPDVILKRIISDDIRPYFKQGYYAEGLLKGINRIEDRLVADPDVLAQSDALAKERAQKQRGESTPPSAFGLFIVGIICGRFLTSLFGRIFGSLITTLGFIGLSLLSGIGLLTTIFMAVFLWVFLTARGSGGGKGGGKGGGGVIFFPGGGFGGGSSGGFGGGGFGGGGFGGGGGGFGGGGAGGSW